MGLARVASVVDLSMPRVSEVSSDFSTANAAYPKVGRDYCYPLSCIFSFHMMFASHLWL